MVDELFEVKNNFFLGNYQAAINEATGLSSGSLSSEEVQTEKEAFVYRSYIAQGNFHVVLEEISEDSAPPALKAVRLLAVYYSSFGDESLKEGAMSRLQEMLLDGVIAFDPTMQLVAGMIYFNESNFDEAMRSIHQLASLEGRLLRIQILLKMNQLVLAQKELKVMQKQDEESLLTQLATAWINVSAGEEVKTQEAIDIFQELLDKYNSTLPLLNGIAVCNMSLKKFPEAEKLLLEALEKSPKDPETMINLIVCFQHMKKPKEIISRYLAQLRAGSPFHPWVTKLKATEDMFDRCAGRFTPSKA